MKYRNLMILVSAINRLKLLSLILFALGTLLLMQPLSVWACDFSLITDIGGVGQGYKQEPEHTEGDPWNYKGWMNIEVTNTGTEAWGDFHFEIFQVGESVENVDFDVSSPNEPTSSQTGLTWLVDNVAVGATLDLFFYSDPILAGETATFSVYTDNTTDKVPFFGTAFYPTPVPIPGAIWLLGTGLISLVGFRRYKNK
jgi:hypothetical protein